MKDTLAEGLDNGSIWDAVARAIDRLSASQVFSLSLVIAVGVFALKLTPMIGRLISEERRLRRRHEERVSKVAPKLKRRLAEQQDRPAARRRKSGGQQ